MATKIETLKKPNGDHVLPRTRAKAVSMESGTTVEAAIEEVNQNISQLIQYGTEEITAGSASPYPEGTLYVVIE